MERGYHLKDHQVPGFIDQLDTISAGRCCCQTHTWPASFWDLSGCLVLAADGTVLRYDPDSATVYHVSDDKNIKLALVSGAERYPDLAEILPVRPRGANTCTDCSGQGKHFQGRVYCGRCGGLGWVEAGE
jgi:hypothetical protein